jgi:hypothetical protein
MMKKTKLFLFMGFFSVILSFYQMTSPAEESNRMSKELIKPRPMTIRETEILGTLEKPQFSTDLPWKSPSVNKITSAQSRRQFKKEIFRSIHP